MVLGLGVAWAVGLVFCLVLLNYEISPNPYRPCLTIEGGVQTAYKIYMYTIFIQTHTHTHTHTQMVTKTQLRHSILNSIKKLETYKSELPLVIAEGLYVTNLNKLVESAEILATIIATLGIPVTLVAAHPIIANQTVPRSSEPPYNYSVITKYPTIAQAIQVLSACAKNDAFLTALAKAICAARTSFIVDMPI